MTHVCLLNSHQSPTAHPLLPAYSQGSIANDPSLLVPQNLSELRRVPGLIRVYIPLWKEKNMIILMFYRHTNSLFIFTCGYLKLTEDLFAYHLYNLKMIKTNKKHSTKDQFTALFYKNKVKNNIKSCQVVKSFHSPKHNNKLLALNNKKMLHILYNCLVFCFLPPLPASGTC